MRSSSRSLRGAPDRLRPFLQTSGAPPSIPATINRKSLSHEADLYRCRNIIGRASGWLKNFRAIAGGYPKAARLRRVAARLY